MSGQRSFRRHLALSTLAVAMIGCGLSVVGTEGSSSSSGGPGDGGREAAPVDAGSDVIEDASSDAPACDGSATCTPTDLVVLPLGQTVRAVAISSQALYFINETSKTIVSAGLDGSNPTDLVTTTQAARQLTVDDTYVWYTGPDLHRFRISTGTDVLVATGVTGCVSVDPSKTVVYAADFAGNRIVSALYAGAGGVDYLTGKEGVAFPWGVAATANDVYFTTSGARSGFIYRRPKIGTVNTVVKHDQLNPNCLTFDSSEQLYWVNNADGSIHRSKADGTDEVVLVAGQANVTQVAVDDNFLYWGTQNKVKRLAR